MRGWTRVLLATLFVPAIARSQEAGGDSVTRAMVEEGIARAKAGDRGEFAEVKPGRINLRGTGFVVRLEGPVNRIESYARERMKKYLAVVPESIPPALLSPRLSVVATPMLQVSSISNGKQQVTPPATHAVVAMSGEQIVQPESVDPFDVEVNGLREGYSAAPKHSTKGIRAIFPWTTLVPGAFEIRIVTEGQEFSYKVDGKQRALIK